jgi:hypothetical protein
MRKFWGIFAALCLVSGVTACSEETVAQPPPVVSSPVATTPVSPATPAPGLGSKGDDVFVRSTPPPPPLSPEKITAACPLLRVVDVERIEGGTWGARADEGTSEKYGKGMVYRCSYPTQYAGYGNLPPAQLSVTAVPGKASPASELKVAAEECVKPAVAISGAGESASYCEVNEYRDLVMVGKRAHGETRVAAIDINRTRAEVYVEVAKLLAERI